MSLLSSQPVLGPAPTLCEMPCLALQILKFSNNCVTLKLG
jgi:hypothetical protein